MKGNLVLSLPRAFLGHAERYAASAMWVAEMGSRNSVGGHDISCLCTVGRRQFEEENESGTGSRFGDCTVLNRDGD